MNSPYNGLSNNQWKSKTEELVRLHPLAMEELIAVVLEAWEGIMQTKIAGKLAIGVDIFPQPQIIGNYLHELIPIILEQKYSGQWSRDVHKDDKDLVYIPDCRFSVEIKTSSNPNNVYGNASYGKEDSSSVSSKSGDGYYLTINFEKFQLGNPSYRPEIRKIRFGWIDHSDWHSQAASSGQQAHISPEVRDNKLLLIYDKNKGGKLI
nr:MAG TPA: ScaI restriction endonuclease [Caudoviricetes sp.]